MSKKVQLDGYEIRATVAANILGGMIASPPLCDRTKIDKNKWCKIALEWADMLLEKARVR